jgi:hypothetical protein
MDYRVLWPQRRVTRPWYLWARSLDPVGFRASLLATSHRLMENAHG